MNGTSKFRKATSPAFRPGEHWKSVSGGIKCWIISVRKYPGCSGNHCSNYEVTYNYSDGRTSSKDAWNFQVRYAHVADMKDTDEFKVR